MGELGLADQCWIQKQEIVGMSPISQSVVSLRKVNKVKISFRGRGTHLPFETNGPDSYFCYVGLTTPPPQQASYLLSNMLTVAGLKPTTLCL